MPAYDTYCPNCKRYEQVHKRMDAPLPDCLHCGSQLQRAFVTPAPVHFHASGFYATDVSRFEKQVGAERYARFVKQRDDAERRARAGRLTPYERALEQA